MSESNQKINALRGRMQMRLADVMQRSGRTRFRADDFAIVPLQVATADLPPSFEGYRIVQISDIHMGHWINAERLHGVVDLVNAQQPDLVAITGDFVSYVLAPLAADMTAALKRLTPRDTAVAVMGNHDHWLDVDGVRQILQDSGVVELNNTIHTLLRGDDKLHIAGVDDIIAGHPRLDLVLEQLPPPDSEQSNSRAILLAHEPDFADTSAATGRFFLQLSGHSHGGQIVLPRIGPIARMHMFRKYPLGRYQVGDMVQYTNPGVGTHVLRLRINCPPEITVITLTSKKTP